MRWLIERERKSGVREILLWVMDSNASARGFYFRTGFRSTGRIQPVPGQENRTEELLSFVVGRWGLRER
jgi:ribosomal protein S18 acetylase RimI-like enzyme